MAQPIRARNICVQNICRLFKVKRSGRQLMQCREDESSLQSSQMQLRRHIGMDSMESGTSVSRCPWTVKKSSSGVESSDTPLHAFYSAGIRSKCLLPIQCHALDGVDDASSKSPSIASEI